MLKWYRAVVERIAEKTTMTIGTAEYVSLSVLMFTGWIIWNTSTSTFAFRFDNYPFLILNLVLSAQAMITAPLIMIAQNKAAERERILEERQKEMDDAFKAFLSESMKNQESLLAGVDIAMQGVQHSLEAVEGVLSKDIRLEDVKDTLEEVRRMLSRDKRNEKGRDPRPNCGDRE